MGYNGVSSLRFWCLMSSVPAAVVAASNPAGASNYFKYLVCPPANHAGLFCLWGRDRDTMNCGLGRNDSRASPFYSVFDIAGARGRTPLEVFTPSL